MIIDSQNFKKTSLRIPIIQNSFKLRREIKNKKTKEFMKIMKSLGNLLIAKSVIYMGKKKKNLKNSSKFTTVFD